jgi:hypothetical protein
MKTNSSVWLLLFTILVLGLNACNYEDGPVLSLRSKGTRMRFTRPLTYYENNSIDSTAALNQRFEDSIPGFQGEFRFDYEPSDELQGIFYGERSIFAESVGSWEIDGYDDFERYPCLSATRLGRHTGGRSRA